MDIGEKFILIGNKKYFFNEITLITGSKKMDFEIAKENLQIFCHIIEQTDIKYGLFWGTLLGAIRERNFILHDYDTDIFILHEEKEKFLKLLFQFQKEGLELIRVENDLISLMRKNEYIDIYIFKSKKKFGIVRLRVFGNQFEIAPEYLESPKRYMFLGLNVYIPNNPEKLLRKMYGRNWKIPIKNRQASPNTIYKRLSSLTPIFKKFRSYGAVEKVTKSYLKKWSL